MIKNIVIATVLLVFSQSCHAEDWYNTYGKSNKTVFLDLDSVVKVEDGTVFNVMYYSKGYTEPVIYTVFADDYNKAAILDTLKLQEYHKIMNDDMTLTLDESKLKYVGNDSVLYKACDIAKNREKIIAAKNSEGTIKTGIIADELFSYEKEPLISDDLYRSEYLNQLQKQIKINWNPPESENNNSALLFFTVSRDGRITDLNIKKSSGNTIFDKSAVKAVRASEPFMPFPREYKGGSMSIEFNFDYNVVFQYE